MVSRPETDSGAPVDLRGLAGHRVEQAFRRFNHDVAGAATEVLSEIAARLDASTSAADELLLAFLSRRPLDDVAATLGCEASALEFFPRAFVQPVTEALVREDTATGSRAAETGQGTSRVADRSRHRVQVAAGRHSWPCWVMSLSSGVVAGSSVLSARQNGRFNGPPARVVAKPTPTDSNTMSRNPGATCVLRSVVAVGRISRRSTSASTGPRCPWSMSLLRLSSTCGRARRGSRSYNPICWGCRL